MRRMLARIAVLFAAVGFVAGDTPVGFVAGGAPVGLFVTGDAPPFVDSVPDPYVFTSADVGFIDGSDPQGRPGRVAAMDAYVGDKKPIIRIDMYWNEVQPHRGVPPNWTSLDGYVDAAYEQGVRVLLILDYAAAWATSDGATKSFPSDDAAWADIVRQAVAHFGAKVQAYEVWNEPNIKHFGKYGDNSVNARVERYWQLAKIAYQEVHAGCPRCVVLAGASAGGDAVDNEASDWLEWAYQHGMAGYLDAVAYHPYPDFAGGHLPSYAQNPCQNPPHWYRYWSWFGPDDPKCGGLAALRAVMVRHGDAGKQIWATEFGFPSDGWRHPQTAEHVRDAIEEGVRMWRSLPYAGPLFLYSFQDVQQGFPLCVAHPHNSECHFGLRDSAGNPKEPTYSDVRAALIGDDWLPTLAPGRSLFRGAAMRSANGQFTLRMQADGNLVLYDLRGGAPASIWVRGGRRGYRLVNQHDGNLVLYDYADRPLWLTGTQGEGDSALRLRDDGALELQPASARPGEPSWDSSDLFATGVETFQTGITWTNTLSQDAPGAGLLNVTGPELFIGAGPAGAHSGAKALVYAGKDTNATSSFAYTKAFRLGGPTVTPTTRLSYWIFPQSSATSGGLATGTNSTCVAVDLILTTPATGARTSLRDSGAIDERGNRAHPAAQCGKLTLDTWNFVSVPLGAVAAGKKIVQLDIGYDQPANTGGYRGFIDDIRITG